jgi:Asp-tRNA(Asn)/Glu-tRNA(Gln) amidotransferase C subunit
VKPELIASDQKNKAMEKIMSLELLSSIKGARQSDAIAELFRVIKDAFPENENSGSVSELDESVMYFENLREDNVIESDTREKELITGNFPKEKNGYLVVSKAIED